MTKEVVGNTLCLRLSLLLLILLLFSLFILSKILFNLNTKTSAFNINYSPAGASHSHIISSVLENSELNSPLEGLLNIIFSFNILIFIMTMLMFILLFNRIILQLNIQILSYFIYKYGNNKFINWFNQTKNKGLILSNKVLLYFFIFNFIFLIIVSLINLNFILELILNIDDYVFVFNELKKK